MRAIGSGGILRAVAGALKELEPSIKIGQDGAAFSSVLSLRGMVWKIVNAIGYSRKARERGRVFIVLDEVRVPREGAQDFIDWLERFANDVRRADKAYYERMGGLITVVALTSDALAIKAWSKVGEKVGWTLMWSLPRGAADRLAEQLGIRGDRDLLWRFAGAARWRLGT